MVENKSPGPGLRGERPWEQRLLLGGPGDRSPVCLGFTEQTLQSRGGEPSHTRVWCVLSQGGVFQYHRPSSGIAFWCLRGKKGVIGKSHVPSDS